MFKVSTAISRRRQKSWLKPQWRKLLLKGKWSTRINKPYNSKSFKLHGLQWQEQFEHCDTRRHQCAALKLHKENDKPGIDEQFRIHTVLCKHKKSENVKLVCLERLKKKKKENELNILNPVLTWSLQETCCDDKKIKFGKEK